MYKGDLTNTYSSN